MLSGGRGVRNFRGGLHIGVRIIDKFFLCWSHASSSWRVDRCGTTWRGPGDYYFKGQWERRAECKQGWNCGQDNSYPHWCTRSLHGYDCALNFSSPFSREIGNLFSFVYWSFFFSMQIFFFYVRERKRTTNRSLVIKLVGFNLTANKIIRQAPQKIN